MQSESLIPGMVIAGKYVVERTLGRGGMGAVYVASHAHTGKRMAMKVLLPEFVHNADLVGRFLREAQVMGRLQHRHVVDVFDVGRDGDVLYIVMELLEGKPLSELLHDAGLTLEEALLILMRAMEGVSAAHDHGVVHRDLKPDNIFVCVGASGRLDDPRVLDFGISKLDDGAAQQLTRSGVAMGTPYYMSIEQLSGQRDLDHRVDVYALGVILYEAMAGQPPYVADSISALAIRVITTHAAHLGQLRPDLPPGLADVVMKAIARNRDDRHRSVRALIEALRPFVPRSAGLSIAEGQGRLLRTPRSGGVARAAALESGSQPTLGAHYGAGDARFSAPQTGSLATKPSAPSWSKPVLLTVLALLLLGGLGALLVRQASEPSAGARPHPTLPEVAPSPAAPVQQARRATEPPTPALKVAPAVEIVEQAPDAAAPRGASPTRVERAPSRAASARPKAERAATAKSRPAARSSEPSVSEAPARAEPARPATEGATTPAPAAGAPRKSAEGRAGKLGSDEF